MRLRSQSSATLPDVFWDVEGTSLLRFVHVKVTYGCKVRHFSMLKYSSLLIAPIGGMRGLRARALAMRLAALKIGKRAEAR